MPIVSLPNGQELEFPEGMPEDAMRTAIYKQFPEFKPQEQNLLQKAGDIADKYINKPVESLRIPELGAGLLQGGERALASAINLVPMIAGSEKRVPYADFSKYFPDDPYSRAALFAGDVAGQAIPASKAMQALGALGTPSMLKNIASGATSGFAFGGSPDDDMFTRLTSALIGGIIPGVSSLSNKNIAKNVLKQKAAKQSEFANQYENLLGDIEEKAGQESRIPITESLTNPKQEKLINKLTPTDKKLLDSYNEYNEQPTFRNAHRAQSELGKIIKSLENSVKRAKSTDRPVPGRTYKQIDAVKELRDKVKSQMTDYLQSNNLSEELEQYKNLTGRYKTEMVPYGEPAIAKYEAGKTRPRDLVKSLIKSEFTSPKGPYKDIPGLGTRRLTQSAKDNDILSNIIKGLMLAGGFGLGSSVAYKAGLPGVGSAINQASDIVQ